MNAPAATRWLSLVLLLGACRHPAVRADCPSGYTADAERTARSLALLRRGSDTRQLVALRPRAVCYAAGAEPGITPDGIVLLDLTSDTAESAAKLAHLLVHLREGLVPGKSEEQARAVERRVREELGLSPSPAAGARVAE